jgi:hypothetical protein
VDGVWAGTRPVGALRARRVGRPASPDSLSLSDTSGLSHESLCPRSYDAGISRVVASLRVATPSASVRCNYCYQLGAFRRWRTAAGSIVKGLKPPRGVACYRELRRILLPRLYEKPSNTGEPPRHETDHGSVHERFPARTKPLVVFAHPPLLVHPRQRTLYHPPAREHQAKPCGGINTSPYLRPRPLWPTPWPTS